MFRPLLTIVQQTNPPHLYGGWPRSHREGMVIKFVQIVRVPRGRVDANSV